MRTPSGTSDADRGRNGEALSGYRVELASLPPQRQERSAALAPDLGTDSQRCVWTLPAPLPPSGTNIQVMAVTAVLRDAGGQQIGQAAVSVAPPRDMSNSLPQGSSRRWMHAGRGRWNARSFCLLGQAGRDAHNPGALRR
jgi:hypothetical protein